MRQRDDRSNSTISRSGGHGYWRAIAFKVKAYFHSSAGTTAIEYGLIIGGIVLAIVAIVFNLGEDLEAYFNKVHAEIFGGKSG